MQKRLERGEGDKGIGLSLRDGPRGCRVNVKSGDPQGRNLRGTYPIKWGLKGGSLGVQDRGTKHILKKGDGKKERKTDCASCGEKKKKNSTEVAGKL